MADDRLGSVFAETDRNAALAWVSLLALGLATVAAAATGSYRWLAFSAFAVTVALVPAAAVRDPTVMPPWMLLAVVAVPPLDAAVLGASVAGGVAVYLAVAAVALLVVVELHLFTALRMNHPFAVGLVVLTTLAVAGAWNVVQWITDLTLGTEYLTGGRSADAANRAMMIDFLYAAVAGLLAGVVFDRYFQAGAGERDGPVDAEDGDGDAAHDEEAADEDSSIAPSLLSDQLEVPDKRVRQLSRAMQAVLATLFLWGVVRLHVPTIANSGVALAITFVPALLERDFRLPLEPGIVFWITAAVFLHSLGSAGLYDYVGQFDTLTHALSASVVAAAGYAVVRAIDLHADSVYLPPRATFAIILVFVLAAGVVWELVEFAVDGGTQYLGMATALAQHGVHDTASDLLWDLVGGVVAALWGSVYLRDVSHRIAERMGDSAGA